MLDQGKSKKAKVKRKFGRERFLLAAGMILASWCAAPVANAAEPSGAAGVDPPPDIDLDPPPPPVHSVLDDLGRTMVLEDGTIIRYFDDGRTVIENPNRSREERFPGGGRITTAPDGTTSYDQWIKFTGQPSGAATIDPPTLNIDFDPPPPPVHSVLDDLGRTMVLEDGTVIRYLDDGRTIINSNGRLEERFPDGGRITTAPDGTVSYDRWKEYKGQPSGAATVDPPTLNIDWDPPPPPVHSVLGDLGRTMVLEDGTVIRYLDAGRMVIQNPNGRLEERFPDGGRVTTAPDGKTSYDRWKEKAAAPIKKAEEKNPGYGQSMGPPWMSPYGFGIGERNMERKQESDSWPMKK